MQEQKWLHVSLSRADRLPSWAELSKVKEEFIGEHTAAYHVIPSKADHINLHSFCMHLWSPLDGLERLPNMQSLTLEEAI